METFMKLLETIQTFVWGPPTLVLLMGTGLYFTYKLRGIQICKFPRALKSIFEKVYVPVSLYPFCNCGRHTTHQIESLQLVHQFIMNGLWKRR